ncbi:MAG: SIR2 family protein [Prevotellaceae bacterium]|nr:SIR2 family protein [Prevotellaceae bacterium]
MKIKELIQYIQSANINFMIGSGASRPYLATLGSIETWLTQLADDRKSEKAEYIVVEASIYKAFYETVIKPNHLISDFDVNYTEKKNRYKNFLAAWNGIMNKRNSRIHNKQVNLFTTNVDLMFEHSSTGMGIELNDGFQGSVEQLYDESNFMKSVNKTSLHFQYVSEIPVFNLMKVHGSINWGQTGNTGIKNNTLWYWLIEEAIKAIPSDKFIDIHHILPDGTQKEKTYEELVAEARALAIVDTTIYDDFLKYYKSLIIVNPTKHKFEETVMDFHFYELMRMYANALEKENTLLFAAGFSFADEHIASITKRAADVNPTLQIIVFAFNDAEEDSFKKRLGLMPACVNNNISILTPSKFKQDNPEDEYKVLVDTITYFDMKTISNVFNFIEKHIYG